MNEERKIRIDRLNEKNFNLTSLDQFIRHQIVKECWRNIDGEWCLLPIAFTEEWDLSQCRANASELADAVKTKERIAYGAFCGDRICGYISLGTKPLGSRGQYLQLVEFEVSEEYRNQGIGKQLFRVICEEARKRKSERLYISAHSSRESQVAYTKLGCVHTEEVIDYLAKLEPCDVQMEYVL